MNDYEDHVVLIPHHYGLFLETTDKMQELALRSKTNSAYGKPTIYRPEPDFLVNPTHVKHEAYGDISNESASYFFKVSYNG